MTKEKFSWLVAMLCCSYFMYSMLITISSMYSYGNFPSIHFVLALLSSVIALTLFKKNSIGMKLSIIFPIVIITVNSLSNTEFSILMYVAIIPSFIISLYLKDKVREFSDEILNDSGKSGKSVGMKILSIIYSVSILSLVLSVFYFDQNINVIYFLSIISFLVIFHGMLFYVGNEVARKIAVLFPFVLLFYLILFILTSWNSLTDGFFGALQLYISSIYGFAIFIILFLLSLPHYKWKKKLKVAESVTDIIAKNDTHND
ncbi:MAG: hypothetical protein WCO98_04325 [bacterium]